MRSTGRSDRLTFQLAGAAVVLVAGALLVRHAASSSRPDPAATATPPAARPSPRTPPPTSPPTTCAELSVWLCQDFETTATGAIPAGWRPTGPVAVTAAHAHSGRHALEAGLVARGPRTITLNLTGGLARRAGEQWGRIYYQVAATAPYSATQILHSTIVGEHAVSPSHHDPMEVRPVGIEGSHDGQPNFQFLYNVQPGSRRKEFATLSPFDWSYDTAWHCAEWHLSSARQSYAFYLDGREVTSIRLDNGPGRFAGTDIPPAYSSVSIGWTNYRSAAVGGFRGFHAWIDDFALNGSRIGCR